MTQKTSDAPAAAQVAESKKEQGAAEKIVLLVMLLAGVIFLILFRATINVEAATSASKLLVEIGAPVAIALIAIIGKTRRALTAFFWPLLSSLVKLQAVRKVLTYLLILAVVVLLGVTIGAIFP